MNIIFWSGKRGIMALLALIVVSALCMAQTQTGHMGQEMQAHGLQAAHPTLPFGSKITVTNPANGKSVEVTVSGRTPASSGNLIELSPEAVSTLGIDSNEAVQLQVRDSLPPSRAVKPEPKPELYMVIPEPESYTLTLEPEPGRNWADPDSKPEPATEPEPTPAQQPEEKPQIAEQIQNPLPPQEAPAPDPNAAHQSWMALMGREPSSLSPPGLMTGDNVIKVIPGLPNPNSVKPYNLQVGSFRSAENANWAYRVLKDAGFNPVWQRNGNVYRVYIAAIPARDVYEVIQQIGVLGFREVWVRQ